MGSPDEHEQTLAYAENKEVLMMIDRIPGPAFERHLAETPGTLFFINENTLDFSKDEAFFKGKLVSDVPLCSWVPYNQFTLHFIDGLVSFLHAPTKRDDIYVLAVDSITMNREGCIGHLFRHGELFLYEIDRKSLGLNSIMTMDRFTGDITDVSPDDFIHDPEPFRYLMAWYLLHQFLSFLGCKNVTMEEVIPCERQQKARAKRGKRPFFSYHVLKLSPMSRRPVSSGSRGLWTNQVHFCRGHVREYTAEKPLFGKLTGRYWIEPHVRGNRDRGITRKDYRLEPNNPLNDLHSGAAPSS